MSERKIKVYLTADGQAHFVDPDPQHLSLIRNLNPGFRVKMAWPPHEFVPNLAKSKTVRTGLPLQDLPQADDELIWKLHGDGLTGKLQQHLTSDSANLLDLKLELTRRELLDCRLCGQACGVNRFLRAGKCGLKDKAYVAETFVHIAEEAVLTPAATIKMFGCALSCVGCQAFEVIHVKEEVLVKQARMLESSIWTACPEFSRASTIEFVGGNPSENLYAILKVLAAMPSELSLKPLIWNDHSYTAPVVYELLRGVVDIYLPDFKGTDACVEVISRAKGYWGYVTKGIEQMVRLGDRIIVRILVLPGHFDCCHRPSLEWLAQYRDRLWISPLQFIPDFRAFQDVQLRRPASIEEMRQVQDLMNSLSLRDIETEAEDFWKS